MYGNAAASSDFVDSPEALILGENALHLLLCSAHL
jgi:hypothetical protein